MPPHNSLFALRAALYETDKLIREGIPEAGFEATRTFLLELLQPVGAGRRRAASATPSTRVVYGKDLVKELQARLPKMKKADVDRAVRKHLGMDGLTIAIVADKGQAVADTLVSGGPTAITYDTAGTPPESWPRTTSSSASRCRSRRTTSRRSRREDVRNSGQGGAVLVAVRRVHDS